MTREASRVGIYIASSGLQAAMIGFMVVDTGMRLKAMEMQFMLFLVTMLLREHKIHNHILVGSLRILIQLQETIGLTMILALITLMKD